MNKKYIILLFGLLFITSLTYSQEQMGLQTKADKLYLSNNVKQASDIYLKLVQSNISKSKNLERLAECYAKMNNYVEAEKYYAQLVNIPEVKPQSLLQYGEVLKSNANYDLAKLVFESYLAKTGDSANVINKLMGCDSALIWMKNPTNYKVFNQSLINTSNSEFGVFRNKNKVYYVGQQEQLKKGKQSLHNSFLRIYNVEVDSNQTLKKPSLNTSIYNKNDYNTGPIFSNKAGNKFFVTITFDGHKGEISTEDKIRLKTKNLELLLFEQQGAKLKETSFAYNNIKSYSIGQAALSTDEQTLYYVSDMPGGYGGTDIWYSQLQADGKWGLPTNAGNMINTKGNEMFPSLTSTDTLYFASNGHVGMGGLDIFMSSGSQNNWSKPINLKSPINSPGDDFSFTVQKLNADTTIGYFSSNRTGGMGNDDIYSFRQIIPKPPVFCVKGKILKKPTQIPLPGTSITLYADGVKIVDNLNPNIDGSYSIELKPNTDYAVLAKKERFQSDSILISTKGLILSKTFKVDLSLDSLFQIGKVISLPNIYYDFDKDSIRSDASKVLDGLVRTMLDNPTIEIELRSHTDSRGDDNYNLALSERRALSAVNYIVSHGINAKRITAKGYGETQLINKCANGVDCTEEEHQANRRTDFKILKY
jgi:outer membrane protein OmpA-like peptidoglycan-associated protein/tetratricopeptide (TPR) repeat protein